MIEEKRKPGRPPKEKPDAIVEAARVLLNARSGAYGDEIRGQKLTEDAFRALERLVR